MTDTSGPVQSAALASYRAAVYAACERALDEGLFYEREVEARVRELTDELDPIRDEDLGEAEDPATWEEYLALKSQITAAPRGAWLTIRKPGRYTVLASDGSGVAPALTNEYFAKRPDFLTVRWQMVSYEIYRARYAVEGDRQLAADRAAISERRLAVGARFRDVTVAGTRYSTVLVTNHDPDTGQVRLTLTKRGTRRRWETTVGAYALLRILPVSPVPCPPPRLPEQPGLFD